jgi:DNA-binding transcriptional regulator YhcF (GntR family)
MGIQIDRELPVPVSTQVQGQIEYGVVNGDFPEGSRLPSVRDLAEHLGVSPVTVSQVYKTLTARGLIVTVPGRGTFVRSAPEGGAAPAPRSRTDALLEQALQAAAAEGVGRGDLIERLHRLVAHDRAVQPLRMVFVGVFAGVTRAYVADLRRALRRDDALVATTFDALAAPPARAALAEADLLLTFAHRRADLERVAPAGAVIATVRLIPSERTRIALAEIDPLARVVLVSAVPEFLPTFRRAVARFASHVGFVRAVELGTAEAAEAVAGADVVVYGTGSEGVLAGLPGHVRAFEYRHVPDPLHVETTLLPIVEGLRRAVRRAAPPQEAR